MKGSASSGGVHHGTGVSCWLTVTYRLWRKPTPYSTCHPESDCTGRIGSSVDPALHVPVGTLGTCRQPQDERVDADTVDGRNRGPDDPAEASSRSGQCGRIDLLGTRLRKSSRDSDQQHDAALPTPEQKENHGFDNGRRVPSIVSRRSDHVREGQSRQ